MQAIEVGIHHRQRCGSAHVQAADVFLLLAWEHRVEATDRGDDGGPPASTTAISRRQR
jgi:hypothetical protein